MGGCVAIHVAQGRKGSRGSHLHCAHALRGRLSTGTVPLNGWNPTLFFGKGQRPTPLQTQRNGQRRAAWQSGSAAAAVLRFEKGAQPHRWVKMPFSGALIAHTWILWKAPHGSLPDAVPVCWMMAVFAVYASCWSTAQGGDYAQKER